MKKETKLINKVKHLLKKCGMPRFLHHFGPKMYELWQHIFALFIKQFCQLSYRRVTFLLRSLGFDVATKSTLQRYAANLNLPFWQNILSKTVGRISKIGAIDGTGLAKTNTSWHYIKRIERKLPKTGYKLSVLAVKNKVITLRLRSKLAHDIKDVKYLLNKASKLPSILVMDRAYDSERLHKYCRYYLNIETIVPPRKNCLRGYYRKQLKNEFPKKLYNKRSRIESLFHAIKQKFGDSICSKKIGPARSEMYCRAILHNIFLCVIRVLGQSL